jgi:hypothetical protein
MTEGEAVAVIGPDFRKTERLAEGKAKDVLLLPCPVFVGSVRYAQIDKETHRVDAVVCDD